MKWSGQGWIPGVVALFFLSAFVHVPSNRASVIGTPHFWIGPIAIAPPRVLSGDSPHYLVAVNSLIEDYDFDLSNNYEAAREGDWDMGSRFRWVGIDRHVDQLPGGAQIGTHSPFFALALALAVYPLRGTAWVQSACILLTWAVSTLGLGLFLKSSRRMDWGSEATRWTICLAIATPYWCYSRDLWTEIWIIPVWLGLLSPANRSTKAALSIVGILFKYPFAVVPATLAALAFRRGDRRLGWTLLGSTALALAVAILSIQVLFEGVGHFSLFHSGIHAGFGLPFVGAVGLFLHPADGLLWFFPFLGWGLWQFRKGGDRYLPAVAFFLVHAAYQDWMGGTGFSARYLVPMLPILVWAVADARPGGLVFKAALAYSLFWGCFAGLFPAVVYDRSPWGVFQHLGAKIKGVQAPLIDSRPPGGGG